MHDAAVLAIASLLARGEKLYLSIQNVAEFWNVATRPSAQNGLGLSHEQAKEEIKRLEDIFEIVSESAESYEEWKSLVFAKRVSGVQVHDTRLVSLMMVLGITRIITFNVRDFQRFDGIEAMHPDDVQ